MQLGVMIDSRCSSGIGIGKGMEECGIISVSGSRSVGRKIGNLLRPFG